MKSFAQIFTISVLLAVAATDPIKFQDCGSKLGTITSVDVTPCPSEPCIFKRNATIDVTLVFKANAAVTEAKTTVYGFLPGGIKAPFPLKDTDACHDMTCPITAGASVTYKNTVFVQPLYPTLGVVVQWELLSGSDLITCFTVPVKITDS